MITTLTPIVLLSSSYGLKTGGKKTLSQEQSLKLLKVSQDREIPEIRKIEH